MSVRQDGKDVRARAARLVHDVGKYVARTARNVSGQAWAPDLVAMLCRDLYELPRGRASAVFAKLTACFEGAQPALDSVRSLLAEIDGLEAGVRRGEPESLDAAARAALAVEATLRAFARSLEENTP
jgi:hypothetical protein